MTRTRTRLVQNLAAAVALTGLAAAAPARAADPVDPAARAETIRKALQCLVGNWKGNATLTFPDGKTASMKIAYDCKKAGGGLGVACHLTASAPGMPTYESDDLYGYNAGDGLVHWFTITSSGEVHDHKGGIDETGTFTGIYDGAQDGKLYQEQVSIQMIGETKVRVRSSVKLGAQQQESLDMTATKG